MVAPAAPALAPTPPPAPEAPATDPRPGAPDARDVRPKSVVDLLTLHEDNYFITGFSKGTQAKFQFSFKYELWPNEGPHAVQFAYTQRSLWALYDTSSPFVETNYAPELFYTYYHRHERDAAPGCGFFLERAGLQHESNGQSEPLSRGWNRLYAETRFGCRDEGSRHLAAVRLRVWAPPIGTADNPAITRYLGYGELGISYGFDARSLGNLSLSAIGRKGTSRRLALGSLEFDLRWRPAYESFLSGWRLTPHLYAQAYTGYGEMLV
ncbi:MAG: phospholipase A, partial [Polyangiaceae bacterium]|nr:phospholipase A [Polyangiaceae bacterium]